MALENLKQAARKTYFCRPRDWVKAFFSDSSRQKLGFSVEDVSKRKLLGKAVLEWKAGLVSSVVVFGIPLLTKYLSPNFRKKFYLGNCCLMTLHREPLSREAGARLFRIENEKRKSRIYLNVGALPFDARLSGIPRVARKFLEEGLKCKQAEVLPVYADPVSGGYRIAALYI